MLAATGKSAEGLAATTAGLTVEEGKNIIATSANSAAKKEATASTIPLSAAFKDLAASIGISTLALGLITGALIAAGAAYFAYGSWKRDQEELADATKQAADEFGNVSKSIEDYADSYSKLKKELADANTTEERQLEIKKDLLSLQKEINDKYGDEFDKVNLVTGAYQDQLDTIQELNKEMAQRYLNENAKGIEQAKKVMTTEKDYFLGNNISTGSESGQELLKLAEQYKHLGIEIKEQAASGTFTIKLTADPTEADKVINKFMTDVSKLKGSVSDDAGLTKVIKTSSDALGKAKERINTYNAQYRQALSSEITLSDELAPNYENAKKAVNAFNEALASGDTSKINKTRRELEETKSSIDLASDAWKPYALIMNEVFDQADMRTFKFRDAVKDSQTLSNLIESIKGKTKTEIESMSDDGILDNFDKINAAANLLGLSLNEVIAELIEMGVVVDGVSSKVNDLKKPFSKSEMISAINKMSEGFESLDKIMKSVKDEKPFDFSLLDDSKFKENFEGLGDAYTDFVEKVSTSSNDIEGCQDAFNELVTEWIDSTKILEHLDESNSALTISMLENMGVANASEVVYGALKQRLAETEAQKYLTANSSIDLANATDSEIRAFYESAEASGISRAALFELQMAKIAANSTAVITDGDIQNLMVLANAANIASAAVINAKAASAQKAKSGVVRSAGADNAINQNIYDNLVGGVRQDLYTPAKFGYSGGNKTNGGGSRSGGGGGGGGSKSSSQEIDWIDRELELLEKRRKELKEKAANTFIDYLGVTQEQFERAKGILTSQTTPTNEQFAELSEMAQNAGLSIGEFYNQITGGNWTASRQGYLSELLEVSKKQLEDYEKAIPKYQAEYDAALKKINPSYQSKIENGDMSIETLSGDEAEKVEAAISAYDKLIEVKEKQLALKNEDIAATMEYYDLIDQSIESEKEALESSNSLIQSQIDYMEAAGQVVNKSMYEQLISNTKSLTSYVEKQLANKKKELNKLLADNSITVNSEEYKNLKKEIVEAEESLYSLKKSQEEYNFQLLQLPINNLARIVSMYQDISKTIENWGSQLEASGKKLNTQYYQEMIGNGETIIQQLQEEAELIEDAMQEVEEGSENWMTLYNQLQDVNSSISSTVQQMHKMNEELLKLPFNNISDFSSDLQTVLNGLTSVREEYDTVLSAVTGAIQAEMDALKAENTLANDAYKGRIDALQEQLDLLEKVNKEKNLQYNLEKAQIELERARNQKTNKVLRDGLWDWERNIDTINDATKKVEDSQLEIDKNNLQNQMDDLNDELDGINEKYNKQVEALEKQSEKWSEIVEKIQQAQNEEVANGILGNGWKDKVLSGNDGDIYALFKDNYQTNADLVSKYEEQLTKTENISSLLQEYINSYKEGVISYEEAQAGISKLLEQMNGNMSSLNNLQNIYDYMGTINDVAATGEAVLNGIHDALNEAANNITESLKQYDKNADMLSKYESSWEQLTNNVAKMLDVMRDVRDNLENGYRNDDDDDEDERPGNNHSSSSSSSGSKPSGPASDPDLINRPSKPGPASDPDLRKHHKGVLSGRADGSSNGITLEDIVRDLRQKPPKENEVVKILEKDEWVLTNEQAKDLVENFNMTSHFALNLQPTPSLVLGGNPTPASQFTINGGIHVTEAQNVTDIADAIMHGKLARACNNKIPMKFV